MTGGTGFLGHRVVARLRARGHEVRLLVRDDGRPVPEGVVCVRGDLSDADALGPTLFDGARGFVHLAALGVQSRDRDWSVALRANTLDALTWLAQARRHGVAHTVVTGTCLEFQGHGRLPDAPWRGPEAPRCTEESPIESADAYGATKAAGGIVLRAWAREQGHPLWYLRLASLYGANDDPAKVIPSVLASLRTGATLPMSRGEQVREWMHVDDAAAAIVRAVETPPSGVESLNIGTGEGVSLRDLALRLSRLAHDRGSLQFGARDYRSGEVHHLVMDVSRARERLGWESARGLDDGLRELAEVGQISTLAGHSIR